jgi:hypothetical protein
MATPPDSSTGNNVNALLQDSFIASIMGGLAMTARVLLSTEPVSIGWVVRRIAAASITACLVGLAVKDHITSDSLKLAVAGASGYAAPECLDFLLKYINERGAEVTKTKLTKNAKGKKKSK